MKHGKRYRALRELIDRVNRLRARGVSYPKPD